MKVKMLKDLKGADALPNGVSLGVKNYKQNEIYDIGENLTKCFLELKGCVMIESIEQVEKRDLGPAPENKKIGKKKAQKKVKAK